MGRCVPSTLGGWPLGPTAGPPTQGWAMEGAV